MVKNESIKLLILIINLDDLEAIILEVKTAFLNGYINEELCMDIPKGLNLKS